MGDETLTPSGSSPGDGAAGTANKDANPSAVSSGAGKGDKKPASSLREHLFGSDKDDGKTGEEDTPPSKSQDQDKPEKSDTDPADDADKDGKDPKEEKKADKDPKDKDPEDDTPEDQLPFHKHPRWRQMKNKLTDAETKSQGLEKKIKEELEPKATAFDDFVGKVRQTGLKSTEVDDLLNFGAQVKSDPQAAYEFALGYVKELGQRLGIVLPPDVEKQVQDGYLDEETAKRLSRAEAKAKLAEDEDEERKQQSSAQAEKERRKIISTALSKWEFDWKAKDPDYEKLQPDMEDRFIRLCNEQKPKTAEEVVALAEKALKDVKQRRASGLPPLNGSKPPPQSGASVKTKAEPKNMMDIINMNI